GLKPEPSALLEIARNLGYSISRTYMIGDTATDIKTATNAGAKSIGVLWGYRDRGELSEAGADHIVASVGKLNDLFARL
ncbi:MAG: HAD hydrolase-like protein, partial [Pseudomonadota bacterium]|nr:HAD hydrolase-like protein [Pseudomonadota bacterium]